MIIERLVGILNLTRRKLPVILITTLSPGFTVWSKDTGKFAIVLLAASLANVGRLFNGKNITNAIKKIVLFFINNNS